MIDNWLSLLPAVVAIAFVLWRKEVISALILGIVTSELLLAFAATNLSLLHGLPMAIERGVAVLTDAGNARILLFSLMIGAVLAFMQYSGGVQALVQRLIKSGLTNTPRRAGLTTFLTGVVVFIESNLSVLTAGILSRGLFDRFGMSRARLAYIVDSTSAPICILILLNGWGAFVLGLISVYDLPASPVAVLVGTIPLNIYALSALALAFYTAWSNRVYGSLATHEAQEVGMKASSDVEVAEVADHGRARDMLIPLLVLVVSMLGFMIWTGEGNIMAGSGSKSVLYATVLAIVVAYGLLLSQSRYSHKTLIEMGFKGVNDVLPLVAILWLSIALGASVKELGTGVFISRLVADYLPIFLVPAVIFLAGAFASFTTGTSWGTFALLIPLAMPLSSSLDIPASLVLAAVLGGGVFGDHCSPVSDTTAVSSLAAGCDLLDHVKTQLPYALVAGGFTLVVYVILGFVML